MLKGIVIGILGINIMVGISLIKVYFKLEREDKHGRDN